MTKGKNFLVVISLAAILGLGLIILSMNRSTKSDKAGESFFTEQELKAELGYVKISDDKETAIIIAELTDVGRENNSVIGTVRVKKDSSPIRMSLYSKDLPLYLQKQNTRELFPESKNFKIESIKDLKKAEQELKNIKGQVVLFLPLPFGLNLSAYNNSLLNCNSQIVKELASQNKCTPLVTKISAYENY